VNGGGGNLLNPGGDLLAAYWVGRAMEATLAGQANRSPFAQEHMPIGGWPVDDTPQPDQGCSCAATRSAPVGGAALLLLLALPALGRRRH